MLALLCYGVLALGGATPASAETTPPSLTSLTLTPDTVNTADADRVVSITVTGTDAGSGIRVVRAGLDGPTGIRFDTSFIGNPPIGSPNSGTWPLNVTLPRYSPQGVYALTVELVDADGNALTLTPTDLANLGVPSLVVQEAVGDLTAPTLASLTRTPASVDTSTASRLVNVTLAGLDDLSGVKRIEVNLDGPGGTEIHSTSTAAPISGIATDGTWLVPVTIPKGSPTGSYSLSLVITDAVGHATPVSSAALGAAGFPNTVSNNDLTAPDVSIESGPAGLTNQTAPTFTFATEPNATVQCSVDQGTPSFAPCTGPASHASGALLVDGDWTFRVRATDLATNSATATRSFTLDTVAPDTQIDTGPSGLIPTKAAEFAFSSESGAGFECRLDDRAFEACASPATFTALEDGDHSVEVRAVDEAGNRDPSPASRSFSVDGSAPWVVILSGPEGPTSSAMPTFGFDAEGGSALECSFDRGNPSFGPCSTASSATPAVPLTEGDWTFRVRATDDGKRATTATRSFTVDLQLPETVIERGPAAKTFKNRATFLFSGDGATHFECKFDKRKKRKWFPCESPIKFKRLKKGKHKFKVRGLDPAGNVDLTPAKVKFKVVLLSL